MNKFKIEKTNNEIEWNNFLYNSINKNIYCHSIFLNTLKQPLSKYLIKNNKEVIAAFFLNEEKTDIKISNEIIYTPIIYKNYTNRPISSINTEKFNITDLYKNFLSKNFNKIDIIYDYNLSDLRPFLFHNFDQKQKIFKIFDIKYTSIINIKDLKKKENYEKFYKNLSVRVRQQYSYSLTKKKYEFFKEFNKNIILEIITNTFKRQSIKPDFDINNRIELLEGLYKSELLTMYCCKEKKLIKSFAVFGHIKDHAIYMHGGRISAGENDYSLTYLLINSFIELSKRGIHHVDLEGINSPKRAFNKIGFGGDIKPYYHLSNLKF